MTPIRTKENFLIFGPPLIEDAEIEEVIACLKSGWIGIGALAGKVVIDTRGLRDVVQ